MSGEQLQLVVTAAGNVRAIYSERIDLAQLGKVSIRRGSHVEPTSNGRWTADLSPCGGPLLGPFAVRSEAIQAEIAWLVEHWLDRPIYLVQEIVWDTDGSEAGELGLPKQVLMQGAPERFTDLLSDHFGWCVCSMEVDVCSQALLGSQQRLAETLPLIVDHAD
jgi:hypothetical protein